MKKELSKKDQTLIAGIIGIFILVVLSFVTVFQPLITKILNYNKQEKTMSEQLAKVESMSADKEKLSRELEIITKKIDYYEKKLPQQTDIPEILAELIKIGEKSNVTFIMIEPQNTKQIAVGDSQNKTYLEIPIEIKLKAGYHQFAAFVNGVENFQRFMKVDNIKITSKDDSAEKLHEASLTVSAFAIERKNTDEKTN
ncbi:MAG: type 4a pilus biogenesis protein PilO [Candidatus Omnitrophica bacterium]|nr:type 4a pilus biogenesis protein PilO [Candidatus Omnitrophota bacterium]